jgi:hypothetical protein
MAEDERIVEVKTVKSEAPSLSGIALLAVLMVVAMGLIIFAVKHTGETTPPVETPQTQTK